MSETENLLAIPTVILSWISIYSCIYVMYRVIEPCPNMKIKICTFCASCPECCFGINNNIDEHAILQQQHPQFSMRNIIFFMCLTDFFQAIQIMLNWIPLCQAFSLSFWGETPCKILGIYAQFVAVQAPLWHCMLAYNLGYLVISGSVETIQKLRKQRYYQYFIIIIIPTVCCILPILIDGINVYGMYINNNLNDKECWLVLKQWQLVFVSAILISLLFHYIVLGIMCFKSHQKNANSFQYLSIVQRLTRFVVVYTIIRVLPAVNRIWGCFAKSSPPLWLIMCHHICIASVGITNGIVWIINERDERHTQLKKTYRLLEQKSNNSTDTMNIYDSEHSTTNITRFKDVTPQANDNNNTLKWSVNRNMRPIIRTPSL